MDWVKLRSYSRKRPAQKNIHWGSPLPGVTTPAAGNRRNAPAKGTHMSLGLHLKPKLESHGKRLNRNAITKALPNIHENSEVTQTNCHSSDQRSMDVNKDISDMDKTVAKDSSYLNTASKKSSRDSETTSGTTLPTGVSDFLLDCLDVDSLVCSSTGSSGCTSSYSSPEIFRDEEESSTIPEGPCLQCKNSTLLETSKALNIGKMPHLPNLSKIAGSQDQSIIRSRSSEQKLHSGLRTGSAVVAGKQLHKIVSTKELRAKSQSSGSLLLLPQKHKTQETNSVSVNLGRNKAILTSTAFQQPEDVELDLSSVRKGSLSEDFLPNTNSLYVNSEEIVPATLTPENTIYQCLRNPPEICSIIKASPGFRPLKILQHPLNRKELFFPPGSSEANHCSQVHWISGTDLQKGELGIFSQYKLICFSDIITSS
ncbi:meiosis-specific kinetochore protein [Anolis sagrei]|uniref:meiosis-specific kinetochore protein n=1 Tax=Anolis sagrei TaxID=38937 RepID=UPI003522BD71